MPVEWKAEPPLGQQQEFDDHLAKTTCAVIDGGLVGLATGLHLQRSGRYDQILLLQKEEDVARHQSTHNSGILHAGVYYKPGSRKASLAVRGLRHMVTFCREHGIAHEQCGKLVVAVTDDETERLKGLLARGTRNGLQGLAWLDSREIREIEPHVRGVAAIRVPEAGIVDYSGVAQTLRRLIEANDGKVITGGAVASMRFANGRWTIRAGRRTVTANKVVTCAGLHADRVARLAGERPCVRIVPFRGEYYMLRPESRHLVRNLIYPVPNPAFPFLGDTPHGQCTARLRRGQTPCWRCRAKDTAKVRSDLRS